MSKISRRDFLGKLVLGFGALLFVPKILLPETKQHIYQGVLNSRIKVFIDPYIPIQKDVGPINYPQEIMTRYGKVYAGETFNSGKYFRRIRVTEMV